MLFSLGFIILIRTLVRDVIIPSNLSNLSNLSNFETILKQFQTIIKTIIIKNIITELYVLSQIRICNFKTSLLCN